MGLRTPERPGDPLNLIRVIPAQAGTMSDSALPELGKIPPHFFDRVIYPRLGAAAGEVIIGPRHGVDYGVLDLCDTCLALSTDPFFIVPAYGFGRAAWFAFHIICSDVAVSGLVPKYLAVDLNLPPEITEDQIEEMWRSVDAEAKRYGVSIVTGHTARYAGCSYPMVGGATAIAAGPKEDLRGPHLVRPGDRVVITKGPAIETTGLLAVSFPERFVSAGGRQFQEEAEKVFYQMSVMDDCAVARGVRGVRVMHDATECGIRGALFEMARAGNYGVRVDESLIPVQPVVKRTAEVFGFDPFCAISEGTLVAIVSPSDAGRLVDAFAQAGILSADAGEVVPADAGMRIVRNGREEELTHPTVDPYWILVERLSRDAGA